MDRQRYRDLCSRGALSEWCIPISVCVCVLGFYYYLLFMRVCSVSDHSYERIALLDDINRSKMPLVSRTSPAFLFWRIIYDLPWCRPCNLLAYCTEMINKYVIFISALLWCYGKKVFLFFFFFKPHDLTTFHFLFYGKYNNKRHIEITIRRSRCS